MRGGEGEYYTVINLMCMMARKCVIAICHNNSLTITRLTYFHYYSLLFLKKFDLSFLLIIHINYVNIV